MENSHNKEERKNRFSRHWSRSRFLRLLRHGRSSASPLRPHQPSRWPRQRPPRRRRSTAVPASPTLGRPERSPLSSSYSFQSPNTSPASSPRLAGACFASTALRSARSFSLTSLKMSLTTLYSSAASSLPLCWNSL